MESVITNEKDERFIELTRQLDNEYFFKLGDVVERYLDYNALTDPHIVILALNWGRPGEINCIRQLPFRTGTLG